MPSLSLPHPPRSTVKLGLMLDIFYVIVAILFFAVTWAFTKACDKL
jgi:hypothetical protein